METETHTVSKGQHVVHKGHTYNVKAVATLADGTAVAQIAPVGQHSGGAWVAQADLEVPK